MNEIIFTLGGFLSFIIITLSFKFQKEVTMAILVLLMISVNVFGGSELAKVFTTQASMGTIIYGTLLFGLIMVCENYGLSYARKTVLTVFLTILIFQIFGQFTIRLEPVEFAKEQFKTLELLASINPRFTIASLMGFLVAGTLVITLYDMFKKMMPNALWVGCILSLVIAQIVDSLIYFGGSFLGVKEMSEVVALIFSGIAIKSVIALIGTAVFLTGLGFTDKGEQNAV